MLTQGMNSVNNMFGTPQIAVKNVDFESESTVFTQDDLDNPAYASDTESEDDYPPMHNRILLPNRVRTRAGPINGFSVLQMR